MISRDLSNNDVQFSEEYGFHGGLDTLMTYRDFDPWIASRYRSKPIPF